jgi:hypothetical protein
MRGTHQTEISSVFFLVATVIFRLIPALLLSCMFYLCLYKEQVHIAVLYNLE